MNFYHILPFCTRVLHLVKEEKIQLYQEKKKSIFKKKWQVVKIWEGRKRCQLNGLGEHTQRTVKEEKQV